MILSWIVRPVSLRELVSRLVDRYFAVLRQLRAIRRQVPTAVFQSLIIALVLSRLDYCNRTASCSDFPPTSFSVFSWSRTMLHGSSSLSDGLSISLPRSSAVTGCVSQNASYSNRLFWPTDPSTALHPATYSRVSPASLTGLRDDGCGLRHLTGLMYQPCLSLQSAGRRFRSLAPTFGTICRHTWHPHSHSRSSDNDSRHSCSPVHIRTFLFDLLSDILRGPCNS